MADNITLPGTGAIVGTETVAGAQVQQMKVLWGAVDTGTEITAGTPLPVVQTGTPALPTGASTETTLAAVNAKIPAQGQALAAASLPVVLTAAQIATLTPLASVSVSNIPATQAVSAAALPLPTGAAADSSLTTLNTSVGTVNTSVGGVNTSVGTLNTNVGAQADVAATADTGSFSLIAYVKRVVAKLTSLIGLFPASLGAGGGLKVDGSGTALPVSGTVAVSGTVPVSGTFFQATQPVSNVSLPLPAGASTAAKQPALGTAGTASTDVLSVQGIASMTALKVDGSAVTQPVSGTVIVKQQTDILSNAGVDLTPQFALISASASGANTIVAAVTSKRIRVLGYLLVSSGTVNAKFQSSVTPTDLTGLLYLAANTGAAPAYSPVGLFQTIAGEALVLNLSGAVPVGGHLVYVTI